MLSERLWPKPRPRRPSKTSFVRYFFERRRKCKTSVSCSRDANTEVYGGFCVCFVLQKLASRIYETLTFEFAFSLQKKPPYFCFPKIRRSLVIKCVRVVKKRTLRILVVFPVIIITDRTIKIRRFFFCSELALNRILPHSGPSHSLNKNKGSP